MNLKDFRLKQRLNQFKQIFCMIFAMCFCCGFLTLMLCSCGHNVVTVSKGIGMNLSWDGANYVPNVKFGQWDQITYVPRGNTSMSTTTVTGGNLGSGGISQTVTFSAGTQLNEKNIVQICNSPYTSDKVKEELVKTVLLVKAPEKMPASSKTVAAAAAVGPEAKDVKPVVTGVDKAIESVSENAGKAIDATKEVANNTVESVQSYSKDATKSISTKILIYAIAISVVILLTIIFLVIYFVKRKKKVNDIKEEVQTPEIKQENNSLNN